MAYLYVCDACLDGNHAWCELAKDIPAASDICGGGHCICSHGDRPAALEQEVRERSEAARRHRA